MKGEGNQAHLGSRRAVDPRLAEPPRKEVSGLGHCGILELLCMGRGHWGLLEYHEIAMLLGVRVPMGIVGYQCCGGV